MGPVGRVLVLTRTAGDAPITRAFEISAPLGAAPSGSTGPAAAAPTSALRHDVGVPATDGGEIGIVKALLFAVLGGLILNLMPCVFPVLSMKAMALIAMPRRTLVRSGAGGMAYARACSPASPRSSAAC